MQSGLQQSPLQALPDEVAVTLLLSGGQQFTVPIQSDNPLLQQLFEVLTDWEGNRTRRLFQIPIKQGQAVLAFPCDRLIGLITEPPLVLQHQSPVTSSAQIIQPELPSSDNPLISKYVQVDSFLTSEELDRLLNYTLQHEAKFSSTTTSTGDENYRQSWVLYNFPEFYDLMCDRIQSIIPNVIAALGLPPFSVKQIEAQLTAHNDGHYYKLHNDNGSPDTATRELTYVYYFYQEPKPFTGGELRIYDSDIRNNFYVQAETFKTVEPRNNSIVFFLSRYMHEVLPIRCPSGAFADSRFTINGWIRR